jgi:hypothetical protein
MPPESLADRRSVCGLRLNPSHPSASNRRRHYHQRARRALAHHVVTFTCSGRPYIAADVLTRAKSRRKPSFLRWASPFSLSIVRSRSSGWDRSAGRTGTGLSGPPRSLKIWRPRSTIRLKRYAPIGGCHTSSPGPASVQICFNCFKICWIL